MQLFFRGGSMAREFAKKFYRPAKWEKMREYILIRDRYKCRRCGDTGVLEVHHKIHLTPENINDANITLNENNLITLCRDCHFAVHEEDKARGNRERKQKHDCEDGFKFDENGFLVPAESPPGKK